MTQRERDIMFLGLLIGMLIGLTVAMVGSTLYLIEVGYLKI